MIRDQVARLNQKLSTASAVSFGNQFDFPAVGNFPSATLPELPALPDVPEMPEQKQAWLYTLVNSVEVALTGTLREDPTDFQKRLSYAPHPAYPSLAQTAGVQGLVRLQVRVTRDGRVEVLKLLEGEPVLAEAATWTVKQWRAKPGTVNGKPVDVTSTVTFNFQLH